MGVGGVVSGWHSWRLSLCGDPDADPILNRGTTQTDLSFISKYLLSDWQHPHHYSRSAATQLLPILHYLLNKDSANMPQSLCSCAGKQHKTKQNIPKLPSYSPQYCRHLVRRSPSPPVPPPGQGAISGDQSKCSSPTVLWPPVADLCLLVFVCGVGREFNL